MSRPTGFFTTSQRSHGRNSVRRGGPVAEITLLRVTLDLVPPYLHYNLKDDFQNVKTKTVTRNLVDLN